MTTQKMMLATAFGLSMFLAQRIRHRGQRQLRR
jgi:hypothetical protein